jgi:PhnB protein
MTDTATPTRPDASVMRGVIPYVGYGGRAGEAADFYARAFGASDLGRMPDAEHPERLMHAQVEINGGCLMLTDMGCEPGTDPGRLNRAHMQLVVEDGRAWWDRALAAGCTEVMPYERQFWGDDWGLVEDPFGIQWAILQPGHGQEAA